MIETMIKNELSQMKVKYDSVTEIRSKDGVYVYRVNYKADSYVLKYFEKDEYCREIQNYLILNSLSVPTARMMAYSSRALLIEDISMSSTLRLAEKSDMKDKKICHTLGEWYRLLHEKGKEYLCKNQNDMYMETDCITAENIETIKRKTHTGSNRAWLLLETEIGQLREFIDNAEKTLTYNDFYYTNMIVSKDGSKAFMFDYNLLGRGFAISDICNVRYQLDAECSSAFIEGYGEYDKDCELLNEVCSCITALYFACCREVFPDWGYNELKKVENGQLLDNIKKLLKKLEQV